MSNHFPAAVGQLAIYTPVTPPLCANSTPANLPTCRFLWVEQFTRQKRKDWDKICKKLKVSADPVEQRDNGDVLYRCDGTGPALATLYDFRLVCGHEYPSSGKVSHKGAGTTSKEALGSAKRRQHAEKRKLEELRLKQPVGDLMPAGRSGTLHYKTSGRRRAPAHAPTPRSASTSRSFPCSFALFAQIGPMCPMCPIDPIALRIYPPPPP